MVMKTEILIILILFLGLTNCNKLANQSKENRNVKRTDSLSYVEKVNKHVITEYFQYLNFYKKGLVDHFPIDYSNNFEIEHTSCNFRVNDINRYPPMDYFYSLTRKKQETDSINDYLKKSSIKMVSAFDTNSILIFSYIEDPRSYCDSISIMGMNQKESTKIGKANLLKSLYLPIPYFSDGYYNKARTFSGLDSSFVIYIIESKPGIYTDTTFLKKNEYLPNKWEHGFSRGIAVSKSKNQIIYWVTVW
jgi:hypothetical protein